MAKKKPPTPSLSYMVVPWDLAEDFWKRASAFQFIYSLAGLVLGLVCIIGGIVLFFAGAAGSTDWTTKVVGVESEMSDAAPGAVLFVVGLFVVWATRYVVKVRESGAGTDRQAPLHPPPPH